MRQFGARYVEGGGIAGYVSWIGDEHELRRVVDVPADEPGARRSVDMNALPGRPLHDGSPPVPEACLAAPCSDVLADCSAGAWARAFSAASARSRSAGGK